MNQVQVNVVHCLIFFPTWLASHGGCIVYTSSFLLFMMLLLLFLYCSHNLYSSICNDVLALRCVKTLAPSEATSSGMRLGRFRLVWTLFSAEVVVVAGNTKSSYLGWTDVGWGMSPNQISNRDWKTRQHASKHISIIIAQQQRANGFDSSQTGCITNLTLAVM